MVGMECGNFWVRGDGVDSRDGLPTEEGIYVDRWLGSSVDYGVTGLLGLRPGLGYQVPSNVLD